MLEIKLKPCPFCGNRTAPEVISISELDSVEGNEWYDSHFTVVCSMYDGGCGASVRFNNESREAAAEAWNRRVYDA
jgi:hypothetical protein